MDAQPIKILKWIGFYLMVLFAFVLISIVGSVIFRDCYQDGEVKLRAEAVEEAMLIANNMMLDAKEKTEVPPSQEVAWQIAWAKVQVDLIARLEELKESCLKQK